MDAVYASFNDLSGHLSWYFLPLIKTKDLGLDLILPPNCSGSFPLEQGIMKVW